MIAKCIKGRGFRGAAEYDLQPDKSILLETNMAGNSPRELAAEFGAIRAMRPKLTKAVCHVSLSLHPTEALTDDQWREVAQSWLKGMGFTNNQYVVSRHTDAPHPHIHILVNRVTLHGAVVSDAHDYKRQEPIMRRLEQQYGLKPVAPSIKTQRAAPKKGEVEHTLRTGEASSRLILQEQIDQALERGRRFHDFCGFLQARGITVRLNQSATGHVSGISFSLSGVAFKGSALGKGYTWNALQHRGLTYEQDRHDEEHDTRRKQHGIQGRTNEDGSSSDGTEPSRRITNQELAGNDTAYEEIAKQYLSISRTSGKRSSFSKGPSR